MLITTSANFCGASCFSVVWLDIVDVLSRTYWGYEMVASRFSGLDTRCLNVTAEGWKQNAIVQLVIDTDVMMAVFVLHV